MPMPMPMKVRHARSPPGAAVVRCIREGSENIRSQNLRLRLASLSFRPCTAQRRPHGPVPLFSPRCTTARLGSPQHAATPPALSRPSHTSLSQLCGHRSRCTPSVRFCLFRSPCTSDPFFHLLRSSCVSAYPLNFGCAFLSSFSFPSERLVPLASAVFAVAHTTGSGGRAVRRADFNGSEELTDRNFDQFRQPQRPADPPRWCARWRRRPHGRLHPAHPAHLMARPRPRLPHLPGGTRVRYAPAPGARQPVRGCPACWETRCPDPAQCLYLADVPSLGPLRRLRRHRLGR